MPESVKRRGSSGPTIGATVGFSSVRSATPAKDMGLPLAGRPAEALTQPPVPVAEEEPDHPLDEGRGNRRAGLEAEAVRQEADRALRLERALVLPHALAQHGRALVEAAARVEPEGTVCLL